MTVAALYTDPRGPYPAMAGVDVWDETRDARRYAGPWPVVAHPPCGPWGGLRHRSVNADPVAALYAVLQVQRFGGVLEHPAGSLLWECCGLPRPGDPPDEHGGRTIVVAQVEWGHVARKRTWLYLSPCAAKRYRAAPFPGAHAVALGFGHARGRGYARPARHQGVLGAATAPNAATICPIFSAAR